MPVEQRLRIEAAAGMEVDSPHRWSRRRREVEGATLGATRNPLPARLHRRTTSDSPFAAQKNHIKTPYISRPMEK